MMEGKYPIAEVASLMGEPTRAALLLALMDGTARPAGELALLARCSPPAASAHLAKLTQGRLLTVTCQGRHRYYRLAGRDVARAVESLGVLATGLRPVAGGSTRASPPLREARSCYDHLGGRWAVAIYDALLRRRLLESREGELRLTPAGSRWFKEKLDVDPDAVRNAGRRSFAKPCLDWSERRFHLAGALGAALFDALRARKWISKRSEPRLVSVTALGQSAMRDLLQIEMAGTPDQP